MRVMDLISETRHPHASIDNTLAEIESIIIESTIDEVPLIDAQGHAFGIVDIKVIAAAHRDRHSPHSTDTWELCNVDFPVIGPDATLQEAFHALTQGGNYYIVVAEDKRYLGILSAKDFISNFTFLDERPDAVVLELQLKAEETSGRDS